MVHVCLLHALCLFVCECILIHEGLRQAECNRHCKLFAEQSDANNLCLKEAFLPQTNCSNRAESN